MKWLINMLFACFVWPVFAGAPSTSCPDGLVAIRENDVVIATECPRGTVGVTITSCLETAVDGCYMYAPVGMSYTDDTGTYEFTEACPMSQ